MRRSDAETTEALQGKITLEFRQGSSLNACCAAHIPNYDPDRLEALAVRVYQGEETVVTVYAVDKDRLEGTNFTPEKMPVRKFKMGGAFLKDILPYVKEGNFTLTTGHYPLEDIEVINR